LATTFSLSSLLLLKELLQAAAKFKLLKNLLLNAVVSVSLKFLPERI
jgi:hypothetical protein